MICEVIFKVISSNIMSYNMTQSLDVGYRYVIEFRNVFKMSDEV